MMSLLENAKHFMQDMNVGLITPELVIVMFILVCVYRLAFSTTLKDRQEIWGYATLGTFMGLVSLLSLWFSNYLNNPNFISVDVFGGLFTADLLSLMVRTLLVFGTLLVLFFSRRFIDQNAEVPGEFYVVLLSALLGGMMLSGAKDLIMVFVSLETLSISSYVLVAYLRGHVLSAEAGLKYLLYGGMATAILLFGFSILYGLTGYTGFSEIAAHLPAMNQVSPIIWAIMTVMIVGGVCFKLTAAPFHMWAPDIYEGAPTPVVAFLSVVSKIAAFTFAIRLFSTVFETLPGWTGLIAVLAVLSMVIGNVVALAQKNIKRLLAYSTVAHVGYLLLGLIVLTPDGLSSLVYYLMTYLFMNLGAFAVVTHFENITGGRTDTVAYAGLVRKRPLLSLVLSVMLLSLAGIPITAGFFGKFFLFQAVVIAGSQYLWLVVVALLTSTISLYYYLNVIRLMVIAEPSDAVEALPAHEPKAGAINFVNLTLTICLLSTLALGIFAQDFLLISRQAVQGLVKPASFNAKVVPLKKQAISLVR